MSCHLPPLTFMFFSSFTSLSKMQNEDSLQLFWCRGKITQRWNFSEWKCSFSLSLFFLFVLRCFTLEQLSRAIYLPLLLPFLLDTYGYICAKGLKKSGLACCKRTGSNFMWQTKMQKAAADKKGRSWFLTISVSSHRLWPWVMEAIAGGKRVGRR